jgi:hypothetical protein
MLHALYRRYPLNWWLRRRHIRNNYTARHM